jgi:hypothetical protein
MVSSKGEALIIRRRGWPTFTCKGGDGEVGGHSFSLRVRVSQWREEKSKIRPLRAERINGNTPRDGQTNAGPHPRFQIRDSRFDVRCSMFLFLSPAPKMLWNVARGMVKAGYENFAHIPGAPRGVCPVQPPGCFGR